MRYKYQLDNLNCAHCAGKIEAKIAETDGFEDVSFNFATKLLNFKSEKQNPVSGRGQNFCFFCETFLCETRCSFRGQTMFIFFVDFTEIPVTAVSQHIRNL